MLDGREEEGLIISTGVQQVLTPVDQKPVTSSFLGTRKDWGG